MLGKTLTFASCTLLLAASPAHAIGSCRAEAYTPHAVFIEIQRELAGTGIAILPPTPHASPLPVDRIDLVRGGAIVGQLFYSEDPRSGHFDLMVTDAGGATLMEVHDVRRLCAPPLSPASGLCRQIASSTELQPPVYGNPAFLVQVWPDDDTLSAFMRYGEPVDIVTFHDAFAQALAWLRGTLLTTTVVSVPPTTAMEDRAFWALASDPLISPYMPRFSFSMIGPVLVVSGVAPSNEIYNLILVRLLEAGIIHVDPNMIIDTRTLIPPVDDPVSVNCPIG